MGEKVFHILLEKAEISPKIVDKYFFNNSLFFIPVNGVRMKQPKGREMTIEELAACCKDMGVNIDEKQKEQLVKYASLLHEWNQKMNLTAVDEPEEVYRRHFYDCLIPLSDWYFSGNIMDVGSGAGFPGMVWKIARPDLHITLLEPTGKRCNFLHAVQDEIGTDAEIINARAEDFISERRGYYDAVTARAVAGLPVLSELCVPYLKKDGIFLAMKGAKGLQEKEEASHAMKVLGCEEKDVKIHQTEEGEQINLFYIKVRETPAKYPRSYGQIKKKPL